MSNDRKNPGVEFWATVVVVVALVYVAMFGPAHGWLSENALNYAPVLWLEVNGPDWIVQSMRRHEMLRID